MDSSCSVDVGCGLRSGDRNNGWTHFCSEEHKGGATQSAVVVVTTWAPARSASPSRARTAATIDHATVGHFVSNQRAIVVKGYSSSE